MDKEIKVTYLYGIDRKEFEHLQELGYPISIPEELEQPPIMACGTKPEDYMVVFSIYFSLKIADELAGGIAKKLVSKFTKTITGIWDKFKNRKPAIHVSGKDPEYKLPMAVLSFKISEYESSTLEITSDLSDSELKQLLETQLKLVKMQYKHRAKELELSLKRKKK